MSFMQGIALEIEARKLISRARKVNLNAARARGENTRRLCTCGFCLRHWGLRALTIGILAVDLYGAHKFGAF